MFHFTFIFLVCAHIHYYIRYGALAGFGLSLAKWTLIVKRSTDLVRTENAWLWWLVLGFGFLICTRACVQVNSFNSYSTKVEFIFLGKFCRFLSRSFSNTSQDTRLNDCKKKNLEK